MLDVFWNWASIGLRYSSGRWIADEDGSRDACGDHTSLCSDASSRASSSLNPTRFGKIRAESLRCLYYLARSRPDDLIGKWEWFIRSSPVHPGLCELALTDVDPYGRRFALYSVVSFFRSEAARKWISRINPLPARDRAAGRSTSSSISSDIRNSLPIVFDMIKSFLMSENADDASSISFVIRDFLLVVPWTSLEQEKHTFLPVYYHLLVMKLKGEDLSVVCQLLKALAPLMSLVSLSADDSQVLHETLQCVSDQAVKNPDEADEVHLSVNSVLHAMKLDIPTSLHRVVHSGLHALPESLTRSKNGKSVIFHTQLCAVLVNLSTVPFEEETVQILQQVVGLCDTNSVHIRDSVFLGLGKLARASTKTAGIVLRLAGFVELVCGSQLVNVKQIQSAADVFFSAILHIPLSDQPDLLLLLQETLFRWFRSPQHKPPVLRAIMTGLARLNESVDTIANTDACAALLRILQGELVAVWRDDANEKVFADSLRTVGLMQPILFSNDANEFHKQCDIQLIRALESRKTQPCLAALVSIGKLRYSTVDTDEWVRVVVAVIHESVRSISLRTDWDFASVAPLVGALHVLQVSSSFVLLKGSSREVAAPLMEILDDVRIRRLAKFNPAIIEHLDSIRGTLAV